MGAHRCHVCGLKIYWLHSAACARCRQIVHKKHARWRKGAAGGGLGAAVCETCLIIERASAEEKASLT